MQTITLTSSELDSIIRQLESMYADSGDMRVFAIISTLTRKIYENND